MAYTRRRPTGGYGKQTWAADPMTKADLIDTVNRLGLTLRIVRENVGEWNQSVAYYVGDACIERIMKGGRGDWDGAIRYVERLAEKLNPVDRA